MSLNEHAATACESPSTTSAPRPASPWSRTTPRKGVFWVHSYVSQDLNKSFCVYDGPPPEAIRDVAGKNNLPVGSITLATVLK